MTLLYLRAILILASCFFIAWGYIVLNIAADLIIWNSLFIIINIIYAIPLIKEQKPIKLPKDHRKIYYDYFSRKMSKAHFKYFWSFAKKKTIDRIDTQLIKEGNPFEELLFIHEIPEDKSVILRKGPRKLLNMIEGSWVGMIEATFFIRSTRTKDYKRKEYERWAVSCTIEGEDLDEETHVVFFKWEKDDLIEIMKNPKFGMDIINALYSLWLPSTVGYIHQAANLIGAGSGMNMSDSFK